MEATSNSNKVEVFSSNLEENSDSNKQEPSSSPNMEEISNSRKQEGRILIGGLPWFWKRRTRKRVIWNETVSRSGSGEDRRSEDSL
jgi:hypothetical protein